MVRFEGHDRHFRASRRSLSGLGQVVAAGKPNLILSQMVKTGAVVIDVGINRLPDGRIAGDVDSEGVSRRYPTLRRYRVVSDLCIVHRTKTNCAPR